MIFFFISRLGFRDWEKILLYPTFCPASRVGGSSTLMTSCLGAMSTPKSPGVFLAIGFFLAFYKWKKSLLYIMMNTETGLKIRKYFGLSWGQVTLLVIGSVFILVCKISVKLKIYFFMYCLNFENYSVKRNLMRLIIRISVV